MLKHDLSKLYERYGYRRFRMTKFEPYDLYADNRDFLDSTRIITFTDRDGTLLALPPDVTLSVLNSGAGKEQRVYYHESVYRSKEGHFREIPQTGIERVGLIDAYAEAEVLMLAARTMEQIDPDAILRLSDVSFLHLLFPALHLEEETERQLMSLLSVKNRAGIEALYAKQLISREACDAFCALADLYLPLKEGLAFLKEQPVFSCCLPVIDHLEQLACVLDAFDVTKEFRLDFSLVNSMDYYSGILFQGAVRDIPFAVLNGGRYDGLARKLSGNGAVGFSLYLDLVDDYRREESDADVDVILVYDADDADPVRIAKAAQSFAENGERVACLTSDQEQRLSPRLRARRTARLSDLTGGAK